MKKLITEKHLDAFLEEEAKRGLAVWQTVTEDGAYMDPVFAFLGFPRDDGKIPFEGPVIGAILTNEEKQQGPEVVRELLSDPELVSARLQENIRYMANKAQQMQSMPAAVFMSYDRVPSVAENAFVTVGRSIDGKRNACVHPVSQTPAGELSTGDADIARVADNPTHAVLDAFYKAARTTGETGVA